MCHINKYFQIDFNTILDYMVSPKSLYIGEINTFLAECNFICKTSSTGLVFLCKHTWSRLSHPLGTRVNTSGNASNSTLNAFLKMIFAL